MNGSDRNRRGSCADARVCSNRVISKQKQLLQWPASLEMGVNQALRGEMHCIVQF